mgnify:CR=1 FL=1
MIFDILFKTLFFGLAFTIVTTFYFQKIWMKVLKMKEPKDNVRFAKFVRKTLVIEFFILLIVFLIHMFS